MINLSFKMKQPLSKKLIFLLAAALAGTFFFAATQGRVPIKVSDIFNTLVQFWSNISFTSQDVNLGHGMNSKEQVFFWVRLPRCIMAILVGSSLAVSGAAYQALFRNPLVSPDILGVSAGCTVGAALGLILPFDTFGLVHLLSFACGLLAVGLSIGLARLIAIKPVIVLVLSGMVVLSFFNALLMVIKYFSDPYDTLPTIIFWVMGSLTQITWTHALVMAPFALAGTALFFFLGFRLNILSLGDIQAKSLGLNPKGFRVLLILVSSFMVAAAVSTCGQVSWIGLIIPHMARSLAGPDHDRVIPITALLGALFLLLADTAARSITEAEIPVGIITSLIGAPIFGFLLYKNKGTGWI